MGWLLNRTREYPQELAQALSRATRRIYIDRYRSRTTVTPENITTALSWVYVRKIEDETIVAENKQVRYITRAITRGIAVESAANDVMEFINSRIENVSYHIALLTFNTATNAAAEEIIRTNLTNDNSYAELNVRPIVTTTPNHKIRIYKTEKNNKITYIILNNLDTPEVVFKISTAIMLDLNKFNEKTDVFAEAYLNGNPDKVSEVVEEYYREYNANKTEREFKQALNSLQDSLEAGEEQVHIDAITNIEYEIEREYKNLASYYTALDDAKAKYLLFKLNSSNAKTEELKRFITSCKNNISYISCTHGRIYMVYKTPLLYFEPELMQRYFDSQRNNCVNILPDALQNLLKDIFINKTHDLLIESGFELNLVTGSIGFINPVSVLNLTPATVTGMPNPHHYYYDCWGDNKVCITQAVRNKNYVEAILQTFSAIAGLSLSDTAVLTRFTERELTEYRETPCIKVKETGELLTINEYRRRFENVSNANDGTANS